MLFPRFFLPVVALPQRVPVMPLRQLNPMARLKGVFLPFVESCVAILFVRVAMIPFHLLTMSQALRNVTNHQKGLEQLQAPQCSTLLSSILL